MSYDAIPKAASLKPEKFTLNVPEDELERFRQLLKLSPLAPKTYENLQTDPNLFGVSHEWMSKTKEHWESGYDWRKAEARVNSFPNFKVQIKDDDGHDFSIHFAALFSQKQDAIPITFLHGWPGSFFEFLGLLSVVKGQYSPQDLPYHIIVPSLPGYALSSGPPLDKDFTMEDIARIVDKLMLGLGFGGGYIAQGGDIGSYVSRVLSTYPSCRAIHLNFSAMLKPDGVADDVLDADEQHALQRAVEFREHGSAYALEHGTRPATIGFALAASPLALLAWIGEKFLTWTDTVPPLDDTLDSVTLYWLTQSFPRCIYPYRQAYPRRTPGRNHHNQYHVEKPLGFSSFPKEIIPILQKWIASSGNLVWYKAHDEGGHFAAMEKPKLVWGDVEDFVKQVWK